MYTLYVHTVYVHTEGSLLKMPVRNEFSERAVRFTRSMRSVHAVCSMQFESMRSMRGVTVNSHYVTPESLEYGLTTLPSKLRSIWSSSESLSDLVPCALW